MALLFNPSILIWLIPLIIWDAVWKAIGLWKSGTQRQLAWFICIFIFNTAGILPIIYLAFFQKSKKEKKKRR
jgi:methionyl-tRNA synthetase